MLEYGGEYFNLKDFPEGEAKTELLKVENKREGKRFNGYSGPVEKRKKEKTKGAAPDPAGRRPVAGPSTTYTTTYQ